MESFSTKMIAFLDCRVSIFLKRKLRISSYQVFVLFPIVYDIPDDR